MDPLAGLYVGGMALSALGADGRAARRAAKRRIAIAGVNAQRREVSGQQAAFEEERQANLAASRALALSAASGRAVNKSAAKNVADISAEGVYRAAVQTYEAEEDARIMRLTGRLEAAQLDASADASGFGALGDIAFGAASLYSKYGGKGPGTS